MIGDTGVLGGSLAEGLAETGAQIAVLGRNAERGNARVKVIQSRGGTAAFFQVDAGSRSSLAEAHVKIVATLGAPTILLKSAGGNDPKVSVTPEHAFEYISLEAWHTNFDLNLVGGVVRPGHEFGPDMCRRDQGSIINIASVAAHLPLLRVVSYSAAKAAVLNLSQFLAREWATKNVWGWFGTAAGGESTPLGLPNPGFDRFSSAAEARHQAAELAGGDRDRIAPPHLCGFAPRRLCVKIFAHVRRPTQPR